jgi:predicted deacylase
MHGLRKKLGTIQRGTWGFFENVFQQPRLVEKGLTRLLLGRSVHGRPLLAYRIGTGQKKVAFVSAIHGNEVGTIKLSYHLTDWLKKFETNFSDFTFYIIPCLNPDGYTQALQHPDYFNDGRIGRFNGNNVDLNRNFPVPSWEPKSDWTFGKNYSERSEVFCGNEAGSEPETQALTQLLITEKIPVLYMFHNKARDVMPNKNPLANTLAQIYARESRFKFFPEKEWHTLKQTGTAKEWCDANNIAFLEIEGSTRWGSDWHIQKHAIQATLNHLKSL